MNLVKIGPRVEILKIIRFLKKDLLQCQYSFKLGGCPWIVIVSIVHSSYIQDLLLTMNINFNAGVKNMLPCFHKCIGDREAM